MSVLIILSCGFGVPQLLSVRHIADVFATSFFGVMDDLIILEWSESQKQFHNCTVRECLDKGLRAFLDKRSRGDWIVVGFYNTRDQALSASAEFCAKRGMMWNGSRYEDVDSRKN